MLASSLTAARLPSRPAVRTRRTGRQFIVMSSAAADHEVVICGGGIQGAAIAYYLTLRGVKPLVVERTAVAAAASGKSGGFLARGWGDGGVTQELHHKSFDLHAELAKTLGVESYRRIPTLQVAGGRARKAGINPPASWLDGAVTKAAMMDPNTAQVTPLELTTKLMDAAVAAGARVQIGAVEGISTEEAGEGRRVTGVVVDGASIPAKKVVVAMGPWSVLAEDWLGGSLRVPMEGIKSTSVVYSNEETRKRVSAEPFALFCGEDAHGCHMEVYPRYNGEVYICGLGGSDYVSGARLRAGGDCEHQGLVQENPARVAAAAASFGSLTSIAAGGPTTSQACMRPCPPDAMPMMGAVPDVEGAFLACGHNCWGILWAPITGLAMSELIVDGKAKSANLAPFSPARFQVSKEKGTRGRHAGAAAIGEQW